MKKLIAAAAMAMMALTGGARGAGLPGSTDHDDGQLRRRRRHRFSGAHRDDDRRATKMRLGMPIAIINKPGAGGRVGWNWFATQAEADGYTLGAYNIPHFIAQSIKGGVEYSADSFEPIANWGADPAVFVVAADSAFNSMADVVDFAKANPGKLTFSGAGLFVGHHIAALAD